MLLLWFADFFSKLAYSKILSGILSVSNGLDPDQDRHFVGFVGPILDQIVGPDLGPNSPSPTCLQRSSAEVTPQNTWIILRETTLIYPFQNGNRSFEDREVDFVVFPLNSFDR